MLLVLTLLDSVIFNKSWCFSHANEIDVSMCVCLCVCVSVFGDKWNHSNWIPQQSNAWTAIDDVRYNLSLSSRRQATTKPNYQHTTSFSMYACVCELAGYLPKAHQLVPQPLTAYTIPAAKALHAKQSSRAVSVAKRFSMQTDGIRAYSILDWWSLSIVCRGYDPMIFWGETNVPWILCLLRQSGDFVHLRFVFVAFRSKESYFSFVCFGDKRWSIAVV